MDPGTAAKPSGPPRTAILATPPLVAGSLRKTELPSHESYHTDPSPTTTRPYCALGPATRAATAFVAGSTRKRPCVSLTQSAPYPNSMSYSTPFSSGSAIVASIVPSDGVVG